MTLRLGVVMDPIATIHPKKDTTLAMLLAAQARGWQLHYLEIADLWLQDGRTFGRMQKLRVHDDERHWFELRMEYIYATYLLEQAEREGVLVVNRPQGLRDANEKLFTAWFPQCTPPTLVSGDMGRLRTFVEEQKDTILKPLDGMGGASVFRLRLGDPNLGVILETLTKRILLIDGEPVPYALARIPASGETRANLAAGGTGVGRPLGTRDRWICQQVGPTLRARGLLFVGLDVIGDFLTEINVTSPTGARELDRQFGLSIGDRLMDCTRRPDIPASMVARGFCDGPPELFPSCSLSSSSSGDAAGRSCITLSCSASAPWWMSACGEPRPHRRSTPNGSSGKSCKPCTARGIPGCPVPSPKPTANSRPEAGSTARRNCCH